MIPCFVIHNFKHWKDTVLRKWNFKLMAFPLEVALPDLSSVGRSKCSWNMRYYWWRFIKGCGLYKSGIQFISWNRNFFFPKSQFVVGPADNSTEQNSKTGLDLLLVTTFSP